MSRVSLRRARAGRASALVSSALLATLVVPQLVDPHASASLAATSLAATGQGLAVRVSGNHLIDGGGNPLQLRGVDRAGSEYACIQGWGMFDGPSDAASVQAIASWHVNAVRVPLNEDCWLGINGVSSNYGGANYQNAIVNFVQLLHQYGMYAIVDLHWSAPGTTQATSQQPMADADHSPAFWTSVASTFKNDPATIFDLYNEPYPDNNGDTAAAWSCWRNGGSCSGVSFQAAGMQTLLDSVRATGATNVVMAGGIQYAGTLDQWGANEPNDPAHQLAAGFHTYNFTGCTTANCWNSWLASVNGVPLITGEVGENDGAASYIDSYVNWADQHGVNYVAWTWNAWGCGTSIGLLTSYDGSPCTPYGSDYRAHLAAVAASPPPTSTTIAPTTTVAPPTTVAPTTTTVASPTTTVAPPTTVGPTTTTVAPPTTTAPSSAVIVDRQSTRNIAPGGKFSSGAISTSGAGELIAAFIASDGPAASGGQYVTSVSGGGLTWRRAAMTNGQNGDAEVWTAWAPSPVSNLVATVGRQAGGYEGQITLVAFKGASSSPGAVANASAPSGAPQVTVAVPKSGAAVWAVGHDWDNAQGRTVASGQSLMAQFVDTTAGDTSWVQRQTNSVNGASPQGPVKVTLADSAPTNDGWNVAAVAVTP